MKRQRTYTEQTIEEIESGGHGIIKPEGRVVFVEGVLPGEVVDVAITRKKRSHAFARVTAWHKKSDDRREPFCSHFADCGGCMWQYLPYEAQLGYKERFVADVLRRSAGIEEPTPLPILGCEGETYYRNKLDFSFAPVRWITQSEVDSGRTITDRRALGFHVKGRFDRVLEVDHCYLQADPSNDIRTAAREIALAEGYSFHDPVEHTGLLRSLIIRTSELGGVMVILVIGEDRPDIAGAFLSVLKERVPSISSASYIINTTLNDDVAPHPAFHAFGDQIITERCGHLEFAIHPKSFYQTNSRQAERLYGVIREWLETGGKETLLDLYCGIGSIGLFVADLVGSVVGIESVPEAVERAVENSRLNGIGNARFYAGDVRELLATAGREILGAEEASTPVIPKPDIVVLDPPRAGLHPKVLEALLALTPRQIIYVSCKPSTQARDLAVLGEKYRVERIQPVDMFPQTFHIENVVDLRLRK
ncbi:MAG: 23S rRNA (uracil(1939)-C(5))-methyltransferase RlmD [Spirochaetia bacterium]